MYTVQNFAFLTFLFNRAVFHTNQVSCPLCVALHSLRTYDKYSNLVLMYTNDVPQKDLDMLRKYNVIYKQVPNIPMASYLQKYKLSHN